MQTTSNYGLKKPEGTDVVDIQNFNDNADTIDTNMKTINDNSYPNVTATGTNAYVGSTDRIQSLSKGTKLTLFIGNDATGNCTLNLNSYGAKNIKDSFGNIVTNLKANIPYNLCYNSTDFILQGKGGGGDATAAQLLLGKKATVDSGPIVGTLDLTNLVTGNIKNGVTINGVAGKSSVVETSDATVVASQMITGTSGYVNGAKVIGTMPYVNPDYADQKLATNVVVSASSGDGQNYAYLGVSNGNYLNGVNWIRSWQPYLLSQYIISGANILGVAGSATIGSLGGRRVATGTTTTSSSQATFTKMDGTTNSSFYLTVSGLSFKPSSIYAKYVVSGGGTIYTAIYEELGGESVTPTVKTVTYGKGTASNTSYNYNGTIAPTSVVNGGFTIPMIANNLPVTWIAFE